MPTKQTVQSSEAKKAKPPTKDTKSEVRIFSDNRVVPLSQVKPNTFNPKKKIEEDEENRRQFEDVKRSLKRHGQTMPIVVRELSKDKYEIIDGFHRHKAMGELGGEQIEVKNLGKMKDYVARALSLCIAKIRVPLTDALLAKLLKEMRADEDFEIEDVPFNQDELDKTVGALDFDWDNYEQESGKGDAGAEGDGAGAFRVIVPAEYVAKWAELKETYGDISDTELICRLIDVTLRDDVEGE